MEIVVLGVSGIEPAREAIFGYFGGSELKTTDLGSGIEVHSSLYPYFYGIWSLGVGDLLALGGLELAQSENEWANRFMGLYVHTTSPGVGLGPS
jgi:hypothetical protein